MVFYTYSTEYGKKKNDIGQNKIDNYFFLDKIRQYNEELLSLSAEI